MTMVQHRRASTAKFRLDVVTHGHGLGLLIATILVIPVALLPVAVVAWSMVALARTFLSSPDRVPRSNRVGCTVFMVLTVALVGSATLSLWTWGSQAEGWRLWAWFVMVALVVVAVRSLPGGVLQPAVLGRSAAWGAVLGALMAVVDVGVRGSQRAEGATGNAIVFGTVALALGVVAWFLDPRPHEAATGAVAALVAVVLSGSRGVWLAVPAVLALAWVTHRRSGGSLPLTRVLAGALGTAVLAVVMTGGMPVQRMALAVDEMTEYVGSRAPEPATGTSVGARFEVWRSAGAAFVDYPVLGVGWGNLDDHFEQQARAGLRNPRIESFDHAHHLMLTALASGGLVGGTVMAGLLVAPVPWFRRAWSGARADSRRVGAAGLSLIVVFSVVGLTEAVFVNGRGLVTYALLIGLLLRQIDHYRRIDSAAESVRTSRT